MSNRSTVVAGARPLLDRLVVALPARLLLLIVVALPALAPGRADGSGPAAPWAATLTDGIERVHSGGAPATLVVVGERAEALVIDRDGTVMVAAAEVGRGRVVALGHGGYLDSTTGDTPAFVERLVRWAARTERSVRALRVHGIDGRLADRLRAGGVELEPVEGDPAELDLGSVDLLIGSMQDFAGRLGEVDRWLRGGGGAIVPCTAWGLVQLGRAERVQDLAANRLLTPHGIAWTDAYRSVPPGGFVIDQGALAGAHAGRALERVVAGGLGSGGAGARAMASSARAALAAALVLPDDAPLRRRLEAVIDQRRPEIDAAMAAMAERPLDFESAPLARIAIDLDADRLRDAPPESITAHPSAAAFPGAVPAGADVVTRTIELDSAEPGWRATGLYAAPGRAVTVRVPEAVAVAGAVVQIGAWRDPQHFDERVRLRDGLTRAAIEGPSTLVASPIGGPIYLDLPAGLSDAIGEGAFEVTLAGAVEMPWYVLGKTTREDWLVLRDAPAPWAELKSRRLAFTIPASAVRDLDDPAPILEHWDRVQEAMQALEPRSPRHWPDRTYRYVADRRLSWGYMYCPQDAPIVIPDTAMAGILDRSRHGASSDERPWGHYHEMGHAHQNPMWTFRGTGEVTVNIFTVWALHAVNGYAIDHPATRSDPETAWRTYLKHRSRGAKLEEWRSQPFTALQTYAMLWHAFGFEPYFDVFARYRALPPDERPSTDEAKVETWVRFMSERVGRDLVAYFESWGFELSEDLAADLAHLEPWMPSEPPRR